MVGVTQPARTEQSDLPPPSPELVLIRIFVESYLATVPRKRAMAFMKQASEILATEESMALLFPIRPQSDHASIARARRQALAMYRQLMPTLLARMPPE